MSHSFVPHDYVVPLTLSGPGFHLEPLGPQHTDADHHAWMSIVEHIRATPGFSSGRWPPAEVHSWVTASRAELDSVLHVTVDSWLATDWPFIELSYRNRA